MLSMIPKFGPNFNFGKMSTQPSPMSRTNQIVVTLGRRAVISRQIERQLLRLDTREPASPLMKIHKSLGIKTRAMASPLHKPRFLVSAKPYSMSTLQP